jgi:hypothetical protein
MSEIPDYPLDFVPDPDHPGEHSKESTGGPGGIINYDPSLYPEGWAYVEGESTPPVST